MPKNMYTVAGNGPCNEELALRIQAGDKNAAERLISQNEGYLTGLARAYTPWCETEDLKQEAALALLDAAGHFDPTHGTKLLTYATPVMEAAMMDYAAQYSSSLSIPVSRYNQLRRVAYLCAEGCDASDAELVKVVCGELNVSAKVAPHQIQLSGRQHLLHPLHQQRSAHEAVIGHGGIAAAVDREHIVT